MTLDRRTKRIVTKLVEEYERLSALCEEVYGHCDHADMRHSFTAFALMNKAVMAVLESMAEVLRVRADNTVEFKVNRRRYEFTVILSHPSPTKVCLNYSLRRLS